MSILVWLVNLCFGCFIFYLFSTIKRFKRYNYTSSTFAVATLRHFTTCTLIPFLENNIKTLFVQGEHNTVTMTCEVKLISYIHYLSNKLVNKFLRKSTCLCCMDAMKNTHTRLQTKIIRKHLHQLILFMYCFKKRSHFCQKTLLLSAVN